MIEQLKFQLQSEGFTHIYEWTDEPNKIYPEHMHKGRVSFYVIKGSIIMNIDGIEHAIHEGSRINIPIGVSHTGIVGPEGCSFIVGEDFEGDS